jgi:DNA-binding response OmpR family regulator
VRQRKKILVVEDDPDLREMEAILLEAEGYDVVALSDGVEAAETVEREKADLVLLDLMMPRKDGLAVLADLRARPRTNGTPVIVVSAYADQTGPHEALEQPRVKAIVGKPFEMGALLAIIARELSVAA